MSSLRENVRTHRRRTGMSQEQLGEAAGLSVGVVRKVEQGGNVQVETIHLLARALGTTTSSLFATGSPEPVRANPGDGPKLMELRRALMPPIGLSEVLTAPDRTPNLATIQRDIDDSHSLYQADRYDSVAKKLPAILRSAEAAVVLAEDEEARRRAIVLRASSFLLAGKYLTQVRRYDMAYHALSQGIRDAREAGQTLIAATGVVGMGWLLLRQDRFDEAERLATVTAEEIEPRISSATPGELAVWGELLQRVASAAMRNNRPDVAKEARRMTATAASALDVEHVDFREHWTTFGPVTAEAKAIEDLSLIGDARGVLRRADEGPVGAKALKRFGRPSANNWDRHRLDVARAHAKLGSHQDAMDELNAILRSSPEWLKHQSMARYIMEDILSHRKRTLTTDMRDMAAHLGVTG
ncbi:helix-turn-helix transcriptional regulator [Streptomyces sp. SID13666]|uniref:helix-turn-helix domain-containing protein n=1 Tax=unclassified Streptomyces TaxID=2593676 RepID=UPI0013C17E21|nr:MULTISPECIES: helix-turn-helix transcriptional regulator [unclassified Streptomyces]NEA56747.1 helix-turn-helix transcriptional regulator [Streptomyces sp. SID13666]NEA74994.1 helix-turn-helix transcriptional regulator [Streptomyces sp. SID13588]